MSSRKRTLSTFTIAFLFSTRVKATPGEIQVRNLDYRRACCQKNGDLHFHWKCLMAPLTIIDSIVVHELCHLHHRDHSVAFWNEVDKVLPDYARRKEWLRNRGAEMGITPTTRSDGHNFSQVI